MDLRGGVIRVVPEPPLRIVGLESPVVSDPPHVVSDWCVYDVGPGHLPSHDVLAHLDRFKNRAVAKTTAPDVVDLGGAGSGKESVKGPDQILAMDRVSHLLPSIA